MQIFKHSSSSGSLCTHTYLDDVAAPAAERAHNVLVVCRRLHLLADAALQHVLAPLAHFGVELGACVGEQQTWRWRPAADMMRWWCGWVWAATET
jgi:hypothetical protein